MRWPFRLRLGTRRRTVRLHLFGPPLDLLKGGRVAGGHVARTVRAKTDAEAWRRAVDEAERELAVIVGRPLVERLLWSVDGIEERPPADEETRFHFYQERYDLPEALWRMAEALAGNDVRLQLGEGSLTVDPERSDGFAVSLGLEDGETTVWTEGWHGHFEDPDQAEACFRWLLTPYYRVVCESQGDAPSAAWIERWEAEGWRPLDEILFRNPTDPTLWMGGGWRREVRQQAVLRPPTPYDETVPGARLDADGLPLGSTLGMSERVFPRPFAEERGWLHGDYEFSPE